MGEHLIYLPFLSFFLFPFEKKQIFFQWASTQLSFSTGKIWLQMNKISGHIQKHNQIRTILSSQLNNKGSTGPLLRYMGWFSSCCHLHIHTVISVWHSWSPDLPVLCPGSLAVLLVLLLSWSSLSFSRYPSPLSWDPGCPPQCFLVLFPETVVVLLVLLQMVLSSSLDPWLPSFSSSSCPYPFSWDPGCPCCPPPDLLVLFHGSLVVFLVLFQSLSSFSSLSSKYHSPLPLDPCCPPCPPSDLFVLFLIPWLSSLSFSSLDPVFPPWPPPWYSCLLPWDPACPLLVLL